MSVIVVFLRPLGLRLDLIAPAARNPSGGKDKNEEDLVFDAFVPGRCNLPFSRDSGWQHSRSGQPPDHDRL